VQFVEDGTAVGRYGKSLSSIVWPDGSRRHVAVEQFTPFSGPPRIAIRVGGPEIHHKCEVHFGMNELLEAEIFAKKCVIVLAAAHLETMRLRTPKKLHHHAFFARAKALYDKEVSSGTLASIRTL
jgi:hypothetical protein